MLSTVRQMQKLLSAQEAAHLQGTRSLKKQLSALQSRVQRLASKRNGNAWHPTAPEREACGRIPSSEPGTGAGSSLGAVPILTRVHLSVRRDLSAAGGAREREEAGPERTGGPRRSLRLRRWFSAGGLGDTDLPA